MGDETQQAFSDLVERYQDMACACAYAVLGNFHLAQEIAQESFITAWQKLDQLRDRRAFPGWLRAIVLTHCHRVTRGRQLTTVPADQASNPTSPGPDPQHLLEQAEASDEVLSFVHTLPEGERLVVLLHYMADYSHAEIGRCLGLRSATVAKRLFSARRRLKQRALELCRHRLRASKPSKDSSFAERVEAKLRPLTASDWTPVSALAHLHHTGDLEDCEFWLRARRDPDPRRVNRHYLIEDRDSHAIVAYGRHRTEYLPPALPHVPHHRPGSD